METKAIVEAILIVAGAMMLIMGVGNHMIQKDLEEIKEILKSLKEKK